MSVRFSSLAGRNTFYISHLEFQTVFLAFVIMATQEDKPAEGTQASDSKVADGPEGDEEWDSIELPDPDTEWEQVYKCAADPHAIDYYQDEGLVEKPIEDGWTSVTQIPEELRREKKGEKVLSTLNLAGNLAGLRAKTRRRLARQRNVKEGSHQTTTAAAAAAAPQCSTKDSATAAGAGDVVDEPAPVTTTTTTTITTAAAAVAAGTESLVNGWIRAAFS
ncbi:uncharacterized protein F4807DRAFT_62010 [Annulohypoxylon truncatum]|uniref:uncharacterized protein n=1 Tax=Annulohypoxylon truncatum TaxID=327061 RepID=UPI0020073ED7|nr:uncharacterized protein F4807DRAFT_62010 [Annulohypoxylon truncatum]KAI1210360.1 hypothetical protein F4807DRAFT_62010 [Annulohypoxylon truncatum]